jgi:6-phosphogluconolactonase
MEDMVKKTSVILPMTKQHEKVLILENSEQMAEFAAVKWMEMADVAIRHTGRFTAALSGGKTPVLLYRKLAELQKPLPWDRTHIFMVDERFVPFGDEESNYGMIYRTLLDRIKIPSVNIHPVSTDTDSSLSSAEKYEEEIRSFFGIRGNELPVMDLILLGIGEDGHTASLFPGTPLLNEPGRLAVAVSPPEEVKGERISITLDIINNARNVVFLVYGKNKASIVKQVLEEENDSLPASRVRPGRGDLFFFLDRDAGSLLFRTKT